MKCLFKLYFLAIFAFTPSVRAEDGHTISLLQNLSEKVQKFTLENGLRVIFYKRGIAPVFAAHISVRVGGVDEVLGSTGLSHMLEHMAFKGTDTIGTINYKEEKPLLDELEKIMTKVDSKNGPTPEEKAQIDKITQSLKKFWITSDFTNQFERRGGVGLNAQTNKELTQYFVTLPRNAFEFWCWVESERIIKPVMRQFYEEREVVREERRGRFEDVPAGKLYQTLLATTFLEHPYRNPVIGYDEDIKSLTASAAAALHEKYYAPGNIVIGLVGDVNPEEDLETVKKYFGRLKARPFPALPVIKEPVQDGERTVELSMKASPQIAIAYKKPMYPDHDDPPYALMIHLLGGSNLSPLLRELVEERKIASNISYFEAPGKLFEGLLIFDCDPQGNHSKEELLKGFDDIIERFKNKKITEEELSTAKKIFSMGYLHQLKSNDALARTFSEDEILFGNWNTSLDWFEEVMKVTPEDISRVANKYLVKEKRTIASIEQQK